MSKKFALKKRSVEGNCRALRCKVGDGLVEYETPERGAVLLCPKHLQQVQDGAPAAPVALATPVVEPSADPDAKTAVVVEHASVIALVNPLRTEYTDMIAQLRTALVVNSQPRLDMAGELLKQVKGKVKKLEAERKKITKPLLDAKKAVDNLFRPATDAASLVEANLVPREYWAIDARLVQEHVNTFKGQAHIPGIEVFPETGIASGAS